MLRWIFLALTLPAVASAQSGGLDPQRPISQYLHDIWTIDQGLPQNGILAIAQGPDGYLWLGTEAGLVRFDGVSFTTFTTATTSALKDNYVSFVAMDATGDVLAGTWVGGVTRVSARTSATIPGAEGSFVNGVYRDRAGRLWVARTGSILLLQNGAFQPAAGSEGSVFSLADDSSGLLLAGTNHGLAAWQNDRWVPWQPRGGGITGAVWTVYHDRTDGWWFGTPDALYAYRGGRLERFDAAHGLPPGGVTSILESRNGQLWVGTDGGGLARLVNRPKLGFERFSTRDGLSDDAVTFLLEDHEGSLWVGTRHGGLNRFRQPIFTIYSPTEGLSAKVVWSVYGDRQGALWIGTEAGGVDRLQQGRFANYMRGKSVVATLQTRDGILWAATREGLVRLRGGRWEPMTFGGTHPTLSVSALTEDRTGALWLGGSDGLYRWKGGVLRDYTAQAGLTAVKIRTIVEDRDGVLWIGTHGRGLLRLQNDRFTTLTTKDGLSSDVVESLFADEQGLWVGGEAGVNLVRNGKINVLPLKFDVLMTDLFTIVKDDGGHLWLSSNQGLAQVNERELLAAVDGHGKDSVLVHEMISLDGRRRIEFNGTSQNAGWKSPDGRLWFPSIKGLVVVDPAHLTSNALPPPVHIERIFVDGRAVPVTDSVNVPPSGGRLELHYTATSLLVPERVRFRYRLEGYDKDWVEAGTRRVAYYTQVPGGHYRFHVRAANNDGVWNESGAALSFRLGLHFYETWWFYVLSGLAVLAAVLGGVRLRVRSIQNLARHLAELVDERTGELRQEVAERSRAEERYRHLFDSNPQPVWVSDRETLGFLAVNDAATRHYGYSREEFAAMKLTDLQQPSQGAALSEWIRTAGDGWRGSSTWHHHKKDGTAIEVEVAAQAFTYAGRPAALIVAADMTARRDLEDRLRQAQKMEAVGQLAGGIAHDLNNVLTAVMAHVDLAVTSLSPGTEQRDDLMQAQSAARRGAGMISKLLGFSRRERIVLTPLHLEALVTEIVPTVQRMLPKIEVVVSWEKDLQPVAADAGAVQHMLLNLANNSADAMPDGGGGRLKIHLEPAGPDEKQMAANEWGTPGHYVVLSVSDNGSGMAPETLARIFEPYFTTKPADRGSGLGMAMVYGLMKQHLGYVLVNSTLGVGTEVRLYFPVSAHAVETTVPDVRPVRPHAKQTILVVEDQEAVRSAAIRGLKRFGYTVFAAADGEEGLDLWHKHAETIDLVVSDIIMPRMGGLALYEAVSREREGVRFLLTSGFTGEETLQHTPTTRALPFLPKPWTLNELLEAVRGVLPKG